MTTRYFGSIGSPMPRGTRHFGVKALGRVFWGAAVALSVVFAAQSTARAQSAYVASISQNGVDTPLGILNLATGGYTFIGNTSDGLFGLTLVGSTLYGVGATDGTLYTVNTTNASLTAVKSLGGTIAGGGAIPGALTTVSGATAYNLQNTTANSNGYIYSVNVSNGSAPTPLATLGGGTGSTGIFSDGGLSYDPSSGLLYGTQGDLGNGFFSVNPTTGTVTLITASSGFVGNSPVYTLFNNGNASAALNTLYAIDFADGNNANNPGHVYTVNKNTGAATVLSNYNQITVGQIQAGTYIVPADTPEPASGALLLLAAGSVGGVSAVKKRSRARRRNVLSA